MAAFEKILSGIHVDDLLSPRLLQVLGYSHTVVEKSRVDAECYPFCKGIEKSGELTPP